MDRPSAEGLFIAKVVGRSMEPKIPNGSWCLFRAPVAGSRNGRILLAQLHEISDPENGGSYTVKRYRRSTIEAEDGRRAGQIALEPINPEFDPILLQDDESIGPPLAEMIEVLGL
jgi:hypothetical protein